MAIILIGTPEDIFCGILEEREMLHYLRDSGVNLKYVGAVLHGSLRKFIDRRWCIPSDPITFTFEEWEYGVNTAINRNIPAPAVINGFNFTYLVPAVDTNPYVKYFLFICAYDVAWRRHGFYGIGRGFLLDDIQCWTRYTTR